MTAPAFFAVLVIGFLLGVAFAAWRQVEYEKRRDRDQSPRSIDRRPSPRKPW